nr:hypothetical protein [Mesorhizobium sp. B2-1-1]
MLVASSIVHRHDQVQHRLTRQPSMTAAILMQHHPLARLPLPLAPVSTAPLGPFHKARRVELRLDEGVAPAEMVIAQQVLVEMLHIPAEVAMTVKLQHLLNRFRRHPTRRKLAQAPIQQPCVPSLFVPVAVASELPLRHAKQLPCLHHRKIATIPAAQYVPKLLHSPVL